MLNVTVLLMTPCLNPGAAISRPSIQPTTTQRSTVSDEVQYLVLRAMLHAEAKNWEDCNSHFALAARRRPNDPYLYMHWGDAALKLGQHQTAVKRYKEALGRFGVHRDDLRAKIHAKIKDATR